MDLSFVIAKERFLVDVVIQTKTAAIKLGTLGPHERYKLVQTLKAAAAELEDDGTTPSNVVRLPDTPPSLDVTAKRIPIAA